MKATIATQKRFWMSKYLFQLIIISRQNEKVNSTNGGFIQVIRFTKYVFLNLQLIKQLLLLRFQIKPLFYSYYLLKKQQQLRRQRNEWRNVNTSGKEDDDDKDY